MQISNIHEAKSQLSRLVKLAYEGEDVVICKAGKPMVRIVRYEQEKGTRQPGLWRGKIWIADDFDEASPQIEALFKGEEH